MSDSATPVSDETLVAYLDGELPAGERSALDGALARDAALKARLDRLAGGSPRFREAFDLVLQGAPADRLQAILGAAEAGATAGHEPAAPWHRRRAAIAAAIVLFLGGAAVGVGLPLAVQQIAGSGSEESRNWRAAVADYLSLYTRDTLAEIPDDPAMRESELAGVGGKLALDLAVGKVVLPDLTLKRAQLFAFRGKPLAQIAYLSAKDGPIAFCIIANGQKDAAPAFEEREGKGIVFWGKGGRGFMLIGALPREQLELLATTLAARVA
jgi:anti-sigma factor RsiW